MAQFNNGPRFNREMNQRGRNNQHPSGNWYSSNFPTHPPPPFHGFSGPPPRFSNSPQPPQFSSPPPRFLGQPPRFGNNNQHQPPAPWNSSNNGASTFSSPGPWYDHNDSETSWSGPSNQNRRVNNVWAQPDLLSDNKKGMWGRRFDGQQQPNQRGNNDNGFTHRGGRGQPNSRGGGRGGGRGMGGRGGNQQQFQQQWNNNNGGGRNDFGNNSRNHHRGGNNNNNIRNNPAPGKQKKEKVDKRDLPENNQFHCEVCDRGFKTQETHQQHVDEHMQCSVDGCRYTAAPKLVQLHFQTQHKTGVAKQIWHMDSPEDVKKWIEMRKKNFPTQMNVVRKEKDRAERRSRGQLIENKQFGKMRGNGRGRRRGRRGHQFQSEADPQDENPMETGQRSAVESRLEEEHKNGNASSSKQANGGATPYTSLKRWSMGEYDSASPASCSTPSSSFQGKKSSQGKAEVKKRKMDDVDEQEETAKKHGDARDPRTILISSGEDESSSCDESEDDGDKEDRKEDKEKKGGCDDDVICLNDKGELPEDARSAANGCAFSSSETYPEDGEQTNDPKGDEENDAASFNVTRGARRETKANKTEPQQKGGHNRKRGGHWDRDPEWFTINKKKRNQKHGRNIMLERIYENEIRHERNVLLQCVHHIVKNNFFGVAGPAKTTPKK